jgi:hypothetical protein
MILPVMGPCQPKLSSCANLLLIEINFAPIYASKKPFKRALIFWSSKVI